jgi:hypothetical protein
LPKSVTACIGELWDHVVHMVKTIYGISSETYGSTDDKPLYGPGQGSTCGPLFWLLCYWLIVQSLDPSITAAKFVSVCKDIVVKLTGVSFVDDSSLCVTTEYVHDPALSTAENKVKEVEHLIQRLTAISQHWEKLLFTNGGGGGNKLPEKPLVLNDLAMETRDPNLGYISSTTSQFVTHSWIQCTKGDHSSP